MDNEKLIKCVRKYPLLYDLNDKDYRDNQRKDAAWKEIAKKVNMRENHCKKAWALLRDAFRRATKKRIDIDTAPSKKWKHEDDMSFLLGHLKERSYLSTARSDEDHSLDVGDNENLIYNFDEDKPLEQLLSENDDIPLTKIKRESSPTTKQTRVIKPRTKFMIKRSKKEETPSSILMKYILKNEEKPDDIDQFFASIVKTVKLFPLQERAIAKAKVFQVISDMEIDILSRPSTSNQSSILPRKNNTEEHEYTPYCQSQMSSSSNDF